MKKYEQNPNVLIYGFLRELEIINLSKQRIWYTNEYSIIAQYLFHRDIIKNWINYEEI